MAPEGGKVMLERWRRTRNRSVRSSRTTSTPVTKRHEETRSRWLLRVSPWRLPHCGRCACGLVRVATLVTEDRRGPLGRSLVLSTDEVPCQRRHRCSSVSPSPPPCLKEKCKQSVCSSGSPTTEDVHCLQILPSRRWGLFLPFRSMLSD